MYSDSTPGLRWRAQVAGLQGRDGKPAVLRVIGVWHDSYFLLTLNHVPVLEYHSVAAAISHAEKEWAPTMPVHYPMRK